MHKNKFVVARDSDQKFWQKTRWGNLAGAAEYDSASRALFVAKEFGRSIRTGKCAAYKLGSSLESTLADRVAERR